jgi:hypothetical protein
MDRYTESLLALSITSVLCLVAWIWARRRLTRFHAVSIDIARCELAMLPNCEKSCP